MEVIVCIWLFQISPYCMNYQAYIPFQFKVHKMILKLAIPSMDWDKTPTPLSGLPEDVLMTILHFLYAECLPKGLAEDTARACVKAVHKMPGFSKFTQLCETFLKNTALKHRK